MQKADLQGMSRKDLLDLARERGVTGRTKMDRDGLIAALSTKGSRANTERTTAEPAVRQRAKLAEAKASDSARASVNVENTNGEHTSNGERTNAEPNSNAERPSERNSNAERPSRPHPSDAPAPIPDRRSEPESARFGSQPRTPEPAQNSNEDRGRHAPRSGDESRPPRQFGPQGERNAPDPRSPREQRANTHGDEDDDRWNRVSSHDPNYGRFLKKDANTARPGWRPPPGRPGAPGARGETLAERSERGRGAASERSQSARDSLRRTGEARQGVPYVPHYLRRGNDDPTQRQGRPTSDDRNDRHRRDPRGDRSNPRQDGPNTRPDRPHPHGDRSHVRGDRRDSRQDRTDGPRRDSQGRHGAPANQRGSSRPPDGGRQDRRFDQNGRPRNDRGPRDNRENRDRDSRPPRDTREPHPLRFQGRIPEDRPLRNALEEERTQNTPTLPPTQAFERPATVRLPGAVPGPADAAPVSQNRSQEQPRRDEGRTHGRAPRHQRRREADRPFETLGKIGPVPPGELERELAAMRRGEPGSEATASKPDAIPPDQMDDEGDPNTDRCRAMARDPFWIHAYWNISASTATRARRELGGGGRRILRVHSAPIEHRRATSTQPAGFFDIEVGDETNNWYIHVGIPERAFRVDVGVLADNGLFYPLAISNRVTTPPDRMSDRLDPAFPLPSDEAKELYKLSGGSPVPQISHDPPAKSNVGGARVDWPRDAKAREVRTEPRTTHPTGSDSDGEDAESGSTTNPPPITAPRDRGSAAGGGRVSAGPVSVSDSPGRPSADERGAVGGSTAVRNEQAARPEVRETVSSPHGQRPWSETSAVPHGVEPSVRNAPGFWFVLHTELVVSGATEPDATVTIQGVPVRLRSDGTFSVRFQLPDGEQSIPVVATSRDGAVRSITARVSRETSRFEKNPAVTGGETGPHGEAKSHGEDHGLESFE